MNNESALVEDVAALHMDIKGYYVQFGFMDNSTLDRFLDRVVIPSLRIDRGKKIVRDGPGLSENVSDVEAGG
jgi:hypothetical protein